VPADCPTLADFSGSRLAVGKLELRAPVLGALTGKLRYGWLPAEAFLFADAAIAWSGSRAADTGRRAFRSVGAGVRFNALATILELAAARPLDGPSRAWHLAINMRPGF
jgi:hypothetical protein